MGGRGARKRGAKHGPERRPVPAAHASGAYCSDAWRADPDFRTRSGAVAGRHHERAGVALLLSAATAPQGVLRLVRRGVDALPPAARRDRQLPAERGAAVAVPAPGHYGTDGARAALGGARLLAADPLAVALPAGRGLPAALVDRGDLPPRLVHARRRADGRVPQSRDAVERVDVPRLPPPRGVDRGARPGGRVFSVGAAPPRLPVPARPRRLAALGLLPRQRVRAGGGHGDLRARPRRPAARAGGAERSVGGSAARGRRVRHVARAAVAAAGRSRNGVLRERATGNAHVPSRGRLVRVVGGDGA